MIVNEITVKKVWKVIDAGETPYDIGGFSKKQKKNDRTKTSLNISTRTAQRLKSALDGFRDGESNDEIIKRTKWSLQLVKRLRRWYEKYTREEYQSAKWQNHIQSLLKIAAKFRNRMLNPDTSERTGDESESEWFYGGQDWRLVPENWLALVMPPLDYGKWKTDYDDLKEHIGENSLFCQNYDNIRNEIDRLTKDYDEKAKKLAHNDSNFREVWKNFHTYTDDYKLYHLKPSKIDKMPKESEIVPLSYPWTFNPLNPTDETPKRLIKLVPGLSEAKVFNLFTEHMPDLPDRLSKIEKILQDLYDDLDPDKVRPLIEQGKCSKCPIF